MFVRSKSKSRFIYVFFCGKARIFLLVDLREFFSDLGLGKRKKKSSENDQLTGFFQSFFFFNISRTSSKTSKVNQENLKCIIFFNKTINV